MARTITKHVIEHVPPADYFADYVTGWPKRVSGDEVRVNCVFHDDSSPSLYCNATTGRWYCHGCQAQGKSIISFHSTLEGISHDEAASLLFREYVHPVIDPECVARWNDHLHSTPTAIQHIQRTRRIDLDVCDRYGVGFDGVRFTLPVFDEYGQLVNIKLYDPLAKRRGLPKMLNWSDDNEPRKFGSPTMLFPLRVLDDARDQGEDTVFITEGELDALAMLSIGLMAVSPTAGVKSWPDHYNHLFRGLHVVVVYDNDAEGIKYASLPIENLAPYAKSIRRIVVGYGKDPTDWIFRSSEARDPDTWYQLVESTDPVSKSEGDTDATPTIELADTIRPAAVESEPWEVVAHVKARAAEAYSVPRRWHASCNQTCDSCPLREQSVDYLEGTFNMDEDNLVELMSAQKLTMRREMLGRCKIRSAPTCGGQVEVLEHFVIRGMVTTERPEDRTLETDHEINGYLVNLDAAGNSSYVVSGRTVTDSRNRVVHQVSAVAPVMDSLETFTLDDATVATLRERYPASDDPFEDLLDIAEWNARNVTQIYGRPDLHVVVDLVFHSVAGFRLRDEVVPRGMLDVMLLGDTRCGKGYVAEKLSRWYQLGDIASGENATFAGLVGGVGKMGGEFFTTWGIIPYNHRRLVIIDEAGGLSPRDWQSMSRVRSEGVAEITKIIRERTNAMTRLLWIANPPAPMGSYAYGIRAIRDLVSQPEDIARFDLVLCIGTNEVGMAEIHREHDSFNADTFSPDLGRALCLWAWSLKPEDVSFTANAETRCIELIEDSEYSASIPLLLRANGRFKIAKLAAAIAARLFHVEDGRLIVTSRHVDTAWSVIQMCYDKPISAFDRLSERERFDEEAVRRVFNRLGPSAQPLAVGLMTQAHMHDNNFMRYIPDREMAMQAVGDLLNARAIVTNPPKQHLTPTPEFQAWMRRTYPGTA